MEYENAIWFTNLAGETIGIVMKIDNATGKKKAYMGTGAGVDEEEDIATILEWGAPLELTVIEQVSKYLKGE
jgi:hypothetical protein